ncbi:hypothetical protein GQ600_27414 [Phytophthora cactorum]|nr:hypothetical protein GQ600_27414 [Phytophthora cactorum]
MQRDAGILYIVASSEDGLEQLEVRYHTYKDLPRAVKLFGLNTFRPLSVKHIEWSGRFTTRRLYSNATGDRASVLTQLVENGWEDSERLLFMLALFLHPVQVEPAKAMPSTEISSINAACDYAVFFFSSDRDTDRLRDDIGKWCSCDVFLGRDKRPLSIILSIAPNTATWNAISAPSDGFTHRVIIA